MDRIRELRNLNNVSQARLAVMAGMDPATLNRIEQGKGNPNLRTLEKLADALAVSVADLLDDSPKVQAPLPFDNETPEQRRSPLEAIVGATNVLVRGAADPHLGNQAVFGLAVAAQALEGELEVLLGDPEAWKDLSGHDKGAIARAQQLLPQVVKQYHARMEGQRRFEEIADEEAASHIRLEEFIQKWKSPTDA